MDPQSLHLRASLILSGVCFLPLNPCSRSFFPLLNDLLPNCRLHSLRPSDRLLRRAVLAAGRRSLLGGVAGGGWFALPRTIEKGGVSFSWVSFSWVSFSWVSFMSSFWDSKHFMMPKQIRGQVSATVSSHLEFGQSFRGPPLTDTSSTRVSQGSVL